MGTLDLYRIRKAVIHLAPVALAFVVALQDALNTSGGIRGAAPWWQAVVAAATAVGVYAIGGAWGKALAGLAGALGSVVAAALTDNVISQAELLTILTAFLAWTTSAVMRNADGPVAPSSATLPPGA